MINIKREVDLSKYLIRTDLVLESINPIKIKSIKKQYKDVSVERIIIDKKASHIINKKEGNYTTISFLDITDMTNYNNVLKAFITELKLYLKDIDCSSCLIVGLGNKYSTSDAIGPKTLDNILVTRHIYQVTKTLETGYTITSKFTPDVMANTGYETKDLLKTLILKTKPTLVIIIDSLCASSLQRINKTIQISDAGINPGSGVGNNRGELSKKTLKTNVLAIGVPTVVSSVTIVKDTINLMFEKLKQNKLNKEVLFGIIGTLNDEEINKYLKEILNPINYNLIVSPKEIDFLVERFANLISTGINISLHPSYKK
ncbi:MAG: GPR endopeptidase [Bacilli bacterium]